jgi:hypothetical protein
MSIAWKNRCKPLQNKQLCLIADSRQQGYQVGGWQQFPGGWLYGPPKTSHMFRGLVHIFDVIIRSIVNCHREAGSSLMPSLAFPVAILAKITDYYGMALPLFATDFGKPGDSASSFESIATPRKAVAIPG